MRYPATQSKRGERVLDEQQIQATDANDRFKRPVAVAVLGCLVSVGTVALMMGRAGGRQDDSAVVGLLVFGVMACVMSCTYAFLGAGYSRRLAHRVLTIFGSVLALGGVGFVIWMLLAYAP